MLPLGIGFVLPAVLLLRLTLAESEAPLGPQFIGLARNSFLLAGLTSIIALTLAVLLAYGARLAKGALAPALNRLVGLGYAVPGSVIAVGVLIPVTRLDHWLAATWQNWSGENPGLLLTGGIAALVYAYLVRFLAVALQSVGSSLGKITHSMDDAARSLGLGQAATLRRVHLPILRSSLFTAALLVFVDVMKELPATLVMRPSTSTRWRRRPIRWRPTSAWRKRRPSAGHRRRRPAATDRPLAADLASDRGSRWLIRTARAASRVTVSDNRSDRRSAAPWRDRLRASRPASCRP